MIGILALEAHRAEALVVGEDLGTVEPWVRDYLRERGILGTSILWFEFEWEAGGAPLRPEWWREYCLASVTTHDLPPTAGYLAGDHVRLRDELGVLTRSLEAELEADEKDRQAWLDNLRDLGVLERTRMSRRRSAPSIATSPGPRRVCCAYRLLTRSEIGGPRTSPARSTSTRTGGYRSPGPTALRSCSRMCFAASVSPHWPKSFVRSRSPLFSDRRG